MYLDNDVNNSAEWPGNVENLDKSGTLKVDRGKCVPYSGVTGGDVDHPG